MRANELLHIQMQWKMTVENGYDISMFKIVAILAKGMVNIVSKHRADWFAHKFLLIKPFRAPQIGLDFLASFCLEY